MALTKVTSGGITADAIDGTKIADDAINSEHLTDGGIDDVHIGDVAATKLTGTIASGRLSASNLGSGTVPTARLGSGTANSGVFLRGDNTWAAAGSTSASDLTSGTLPIARIADDAITNAKMADDAIDSAQIADGAIDAVHLASNSVDSNKIANDSITNAMMRDDAVGVAELSATGTASSSTFLRGDNSWQTAGSNILNYWTADAAYKRASTNSWADQTSVNYTTVDSNSWIYVTVDIEATLHFWGASDDDAIYAVQLVRANDSSFTSPSTIAASRVWYEYPNDRIGDGNDMSFWGSGPHWAKCKFTIADRHANPTTADNAVYYKIQLARASASVFDLDKTVYTITEYTP